MKTLVFLAVFIIYVQGHGYMIDPPGRSSAWRFGFKTPANFDDMGLYCGGAQVQHGRNAGKCGVCGDDYGNPNKPNEPGPGNKYATGTIVAKYQPGAVIDVKIHLTAYHKGYFEFKLCDNDVPQRGQDASIAVKQSCFEKHLLTNAAGGGTRFTAAPGSSTNKVKLPDGVQCSACVLQWRYRAGNSWGCDGGKCGLGYGSQEEFWGCADVSVTGNGHKSPQDSVIIVTTPRPIRQPVTTPRPIRQPITTPRPVYTPQKPAGKLSCRGVGLWSHLTSWCNQMCNHTPPNCPPTHCACH